ncbi:hypothetical protein HNP38_001079 [Chryseobacterium defluvii]|uniref:Immunity protein 35 of polymorphic toxin system n=1 Tax=Chryseobacterium defluvii TaxID=160396 RepID=A0A840KCT1_9FLAO|nr:hypothetical protein [Chryseobacterium defluvii]MBB4805807.1 hypothetical protein [Chryseobacterium defluvii]
MFQESEIIKIAKNYVKERSKKSNIDMTIVTEHTICKPYGMIFSYVRREYYETKDEQYNTLLGNVPFLVESKTGKIIPFGSSRSIEYYLQEYEAGRWIILEDGSRVIV